MNIICKMFGHQPPSCSKTVGGDYGKLEYSVVDGIGREHVRLKGECPRCKKIYYVMSAHVRKDGNGKAK